MGDGNRARICTISTTSLGPMTKLLTGIFLTLVALTAGAQSEEIATCRDPEGFAYFHLAGLVEDGSSGWQADKISNGVVTLTQTAKGELDILYIDIRKKPISTVGDGGAIQLLSHDAESIMVIALHPSESSEVYTFFKERNGQSRFSMLQSKPTTLIPKSSLLMGVCDPIRFDLVK